ncbi:MAG TPA: 2-octaprenyl-6-methoxyphenyl hydroxylase [Steroidobacteraceae bacterium]|nr:2-octaprenyl-6-methoxyphenyl hydroxylase [Steroidobacteraceae bacterium]
MGSMPILDPGSTPAACDVAIVGGGMVGASLAVALAPLDVDVALVEAVPPGSAAQPSFDERTTALSNGSRRILETLGIWSEIEASATAIRKIHVSDQGRFGFARIDAAEQGLAAMGYVVPNRALGAALWRRLEAVARLRSFCPGRVSRVSPAPEGVSLEVNDGGGGGAASAAADSGCASVAATLTAKLVVAADGIQSAVREAFGVKAGSHDYGQSALITTVLPQRFHNHVAYERFTPSGPLALLPLEGGRCALVLTLDHAAADAAMEWSDAQFLAEVQRRFGFRLGRFLQAGRRAKYPLSLSRAERTSQGRCAIVGNAAQALHPVAGMGFNLGLRDVACLAEIIADRRRDPDFDPGAPDTLASYDAWRARDRGGVIAFTDTLVRAFSSPLGLVGRARNLGLLAFDLLPPAKSALSRLSTGAAPGARVPKLARGVALR